MAAHVVYASASGRYHWGREVENRPGGALVMACSGWSLRHTATADPATVPDAQRCHAPGCRPRWPASPGMSPGTPREGPP
jgi:hypothetical protein